MININVNFIKLFKRKIISLIRLADRSGIYQAKSIYPDEIPNTHKCLVQQSDTSCTRVQCKMCQFSINLTSI